MSNNTETFLRERKVTKGQRRVIGNTLSDFRLAGIPARI
jgi:hypothetical protein